MRAKLNPVTTIQPGRGTKIRNSLLKVAIFVPLLAFAFLNNNENLFAEQLHLIATIELSGVAGRIDHMVFDPTEERLLVAALGNNTVEIINLKTAKRSGTITGLNTPQNVLYIDEIKSIIISNAGDGTVRFITGETLQQYRSIDLGDDADNMRYDIAAKQIFVGYGNGAPSIIDPAKGEFLGRIDLPGHPESFVLEPNGNRIFVNVPSAGQVTIVDREMKIQTASWKFIGMSNNFPMALDGGNHRLFLVCRFPSRFIILNTDMGRKITELECIGDADDIYYDAATKRIYVSGGVGGVDVFSQTNADHYTHLSRISTARGARTSIFVSQTKALYVAIPRLFFRSAKILAYEIR